VRATLHDELMHEAGLETDSHREITRRRTTRRRVARSVGSVSVPVGSFSGVLLGVGHVRRSAAAVLLVLSAVGYVCSVALEWAEWRKKSRLMKALTHLVRRVRDRLGRDDEESQP
jgi:hypothetical protein